MLPRRIDFTRYAVVPVWYYCNSKCNICMVERQIGKLPTVQLDRFKQIVVAIVNQARHDNLIVSGAEVTTFEHLDSYVRFARSLDWFRRIQIQTNGRRLANKEYVDRLLEAGIDEFFISFHGLEDVHDAITGAKGSFREAVAAVENLASRGVNLLTNTVFNKQNVQDIVPLMDFLRTLPTTEVHLWNYFPMSSTDNKDLVANIRDLMKILPRLEEILALSGKSFVLKGFPECLKTGGGAIFDNVFPLNIIDDKFWDNFQENRFGVCVYKDCCKAKYCWGLCDAYREKYGDEHELLKPIH